MSSSSVLLLLLFLGITGYGVYATILALYLVGAAGCVLVMVNMFTKNETVITVSYYMMLGALVFAAHKAAMMFF